MADNLPDVVRGAVEGLVRGLLSRKGKEGDRPPTAEVVEARHFVLRDAQGRGRAVLAMLAQGPGLLLLDEREEVRAMLWQEGGGAFLRLSAGGGPASQALLRVEEGVPELAFYAPDGQPGVSLRFLKDGPRLQLWDTHGRCRAEMAVDESGPAVVVYDDHEEEQAALRCPD